MTTKPFMYVFDADERALADEASKDALGKVSVGQDEPGLHALARSRPRWSPTTI